MIRSNRTESNRIEWIDYAKGIAICLVIIGHTVNKGTPHTDDLIRGVIFSFHMPLFFTLSCLTTTAPNDWHTFLARTGKTFRRTILPLVMTFTLTKVIGVIKYGVPADASEYFVSIAKTLLYSSGVEVTSANAPALGALWFLVVLFLGKTMEDFILMRYSARTAAAASIMLGIAGVLIHDHYLPFSLDIALAIMPFMYIGYEAKAYLEKPFSGKLLGAAFVIWIGCFYMIYKNTGSYLELATREYPMGIFCYMCAFGGILFLSESSKILTKVNAAKDLIVYLGKNSMIIYLVHSIDYWLEFMWKQSQSSGINSLLRLLVICGLAACISATWKCITRGKKQQKRWNQQV